mgnify:CR=1 FL=1
MNHLSQRILSFIIIKLIYDYNFRLFGDYEIIFTGPLSFKGVSNGVE